MHVNHHLGHLLNFLHTLYDTIFFAQASMKVIAL